MAWITQGIQDFLGLLEQGDSTVVDVRTPGEFRRGHIPGAVNIPLFSDAQRAEVGTLYARGGRDEAVVRGLELVGPRLADLVRRAREVAGSGSLGVYCWRGGMRSASMAWLLETAGFPGVVQLSGGYKAFRHEVHRIFAKPWRFQVLGGYTGSGKTEILRCLAERGEQVLDLEGLAGHRGSSFGHIGMGSQPETEGFENLVWDTLRGFDESRRIWVEDESLRIGSVFVPRDVHNRMQECPMVIVTVDGEQRARRLVREYAGVSDEELHGAILKIQKRLGGLRTREALQALQSGDYLTAARITLEYYDRAYQNCMTRPRPGRVWELKPMEDDPRAAAAALSSGEYGGGETERED